jgi:hypothetical protein
MQYFTPQRWIRLQDTSDEQAWSAAFEDWETMVRAYTEGKNRVLDQAPDALREFFEGESLHDGTVLAYDLVGNDAHVHRGDDSRLTLLVRPDTPADHLVQLVYTLVSPPIVTENVFPSEWCENYPGWMYDEIGVENHLSATGPSADSVFTHNILLRNGMELFLRFRHFGFYRLSVDLKLLLVTGGPTQRKE